MDKTAEEILKTFAEVCPRVTLTPHDWQRLYQFTLDIHRRGLNTHHRAIRDYLVSHGCSLQKASWLSSQFHHFRQLLSLYDDHQKTS